MKKTLTKTVIIVASILIALGVAILVLSLVQLSPLQNALSGYDRVEITVDGASKPDMNQSQQATFNDALGKTSYSVMQGLLEGKPNANLTLKRDSAGEEITVDGTNDDIYSVSVSGAYKIEFYYDEVKTIVVEGKAIEFDRVILFVYDTVNEIKPLDIYFFQNQKVNIAGSEEDYDINAVQVNAKTTDFYNAISLIVA